MKYFSYENNATKINWEIVQETDMKKEKNITDCYSDRFEIIWHKNRSTKRLAVSSRIYSKRKVSFKKIGS